MSFISKKVQARSFFKRIALTATYFAVVLAFFAAPQSANGQRPRFPDFYSRQPAQATRITTPVQFQTPTTNPPASIITTPPPQVFAPPVTVFQQPNVAPPTFDPFATGNNAFPAFSQGTPGLPQIQLPQLDVQPPPQVIIPNPNNGPPVNQFGNGNFNQPTFNQPNFGQPFFQQNGFQQNQFSNNSSWPNVNWAWPSQAWARMRDDVFPRLLERPRFRHTWIHGNNGNELGVNETEIATTATLPNWFGTGQPLRISPGFTFHFWDGPDTNLFPGFELPSRTHSAYLAVDFLSNPQNRSGIETNFTVGVYSDFENVSSDSLRITGAGLGWMRLNSYTTAKLGVEYFDRLKVKMLPAFGVFLAPNPDLKLDIYFPRPKLAQRIPNFNGIETWVYVGAEYGGGSWTVELQEVMPVEDQVDVNDVRAFWGVEWLGQRRVTGFLEVGYVFNREIIYRSDLRRLELQDGIMVRTGLAF